jgi:peptide subunit release factor RF-3
VDDHRSWNVDGEDKQPFPREGKKHTTTVSEQVFLHSNDMLLACMVNEKVKSERANAQWMAIELKKKKKLQT